MILKQCAPYLGGLQPEAWVVVTPGVNREEVKEVLLRECRGWTGDGVVTLEGLALKIVRGLPKILGLENAPIIASSSGRREILRVLIKNPQILAMTSELKRMKRQSSFLERLDRALQSARLGFATAEERQTQEAVLEEKLGWTRALSLDVAKLCAAYEVLLQNQGWTDLPLLLAQAADCLRSGETGGFQDLRSLLRFPKKIFLLELPGRKPEAREQAFWDELRRIPGLECISVSPFEVPISEEEGTPLQPEWEWENWHTLEDAAESLGDELQSLLAQGARLDSVAIVFPDQPDQRRSLVRVFRERELLLAEPRDPTTVLMDERLKVLSSALQVVSSGFERERVIAHLRGRMGNDPSFPIWTRVIHERGIASGLASYEVAGLEGVLKELQRVQQIFGHRMTASEFRQAWNDEARLLFSGDPESRWIVELVEKITESLEQELLQIRELRRKAPSRFWWESFKERLEESPSLPVALRPRDGVRLYRFGQWPVSAFDRVYFFGLDEKFLEGSGSGDYWRSEREREILARDFQLRSPASVRAERKGMLQAWRNASQKQPLRLLSAQFDWKGSEMGQLLSPLRELGWVDPTHVRTGVERGAHPRWRSGYAPAQRVLPESLILGPPQRTGRESSEKLELGVSAIEAASRCGFVGLAQARWKLRDLRSASPELWNEVRGIVLQEAINAILKDYQNTGTLALTADEALESAWSRFVPQGLIRSPRFVSQCKREMRPAVARFLEVEREERARVNLRIRSLDQETLIYETPHAKLKGRPDQIEETADGAWFIKDYKASSASSLPTAAEMLENGYRLQLPLYALAALQMGAPEVQGVQFIALDPKGDRNRGVFFKKWNGKTEGKLTAHHHSVKSVLDSETAPVWEQARLSVDQTVQTYAEGRFQPLPRRSSECYQCRYQGVCRKARHRSDEQDEGGE